LVRSALPDLCDRILYSTDIISSEDYTSSKRFILAVLAVTLFLAPAFLITMICLHYSVSQDLKIWTAIGWSFAVLHAIGLAMIKCSKIIPQRTI
jgi:hypothetical protein